MLGEEEFIRMLGQGCRMNSKEHIGVRTVSCSAHWDGDAALWRCEGAGVRSAGMQSLLQGSSLYLLVLDRCCWMNQCSEINLCPQEGWDCQE